ncbi:hypothetical protein NPX13_g10191 [Xylaria arbuscula]|uniref:Mid2 domain-containing protein n=1 Tax=Xylaria arbuscula TaxID=114810 RepID=A0A9W8N581_9PEZI|nr:hypothetical protein NPX13_g10191 [Xylaria arbuscula]
MVSLRWLASAAILASVITADMLPRATVYEFINPPAPQEAKDFSASHRDIVNVASSPVLDANFMPLEGVHDGEVKEFDWKVQLYDFNLSDSNVFYLLLSSNVDEEPSITCHYFNITDTGSSNAPTSTSTAAPSSSAIKSTLSSSMVTSSTTTSSVTSTSAPSPDNSPAATLSTGVQAGIGIGAALAGLSSVAIAILIYRRLRKQPAQGQGQQDVGPQEPQEPQEYYKYFDPQQGHYMGQMPPVEIDSHTRDVSELPGADLTSPGGKP